MSERISDMETHWSLVVKATRGQGATANEAQLRLLQSYGGAIQRYLFGALHDVHAAEELAQEFALRFIRGDFHGVDPERGRFRDYVKTVLYRMVAGYQKQRQSSPRPLSHDVADPSSTSADDPDDEFLAAWRRALIDRAWETLAELERTSGQLYHAVLRLRIDHPAMDSKAMAAELGRQRGRALTDAGVRQTLKRARDKFAELLLDDVVQSLHDPTRQHLLQELRVLGLLDYCRPALEHRGLA